MNPYSIEQIYSDLQSKFSDMIGEIRIEPPTTGTPFIIVNREWIRDVCLYLRDDEKYKMNTCNLLSCVDFRKMKSQEYNNQLGVVYHLSSLQETKNGWETIHKCALRVYIPIDDPKIASVSRIWRSTDWHERRI